MNLKSILIAGPQLDPTRTILAFQRAFADLGIESRVSLDPAGLEGCSGLLLPGGFPDVDPARYGEPLAGSQQVDPELDKAQLELLDLAVRQNLPILGVCRGHQLLNVYFGGSLIQDLETAECHRHNPQRDVIHDTVCLPGTFAYELYGEHAPVNTKHHQAIQRLAPGFEVAQLWFDDSVSQESREELLRQARRGALTQGTDRCIIEGIYHREKPILGVQWHPEMLVNKPVKGTVDPMAVFRCFAAGL